MACRSGAKLYGAYQSAVSKVSTKEYLRVPSAISLDARLERGFTVCQPLAWPKRCFSRHAPMERQSFRRPCLQRSIRVLFLQSNKLAMIDRLFTQAAAAAPKRFQDMIIAPRSSLNRRYALSRALSLAARLGSVGRVGRAR